MQAKIKPAHLASSSTHAAAHTCTYRGLPIHKPNQTCSPCKQQHTCSSTHMHIQRPTNSQAKTKPAHLASSSTHAAAHTHTHTHTHTRKHTQACAYRDLSYKPKSGLPTLHTASHMQQHTCSITHAAAHMQQHTCSSTHAASHMQHHTCSITHAASHMQQHTCSSTGTYTQRPTNSSQNETCSPCKKLHMQQHRQQHEQAPKSHGG